MRSVIDVPLDFFVKQPTKPLLASLQGPTHTLPEMSLYCYGRLLASQEVGPGDVAPDSCLEDNDGVTDGEVAAAAQLHSPPALREYVGESKYFKAQRDKYI